MDESPTKNGPTNASLRAQLRAGVRGSAAARQLILVQRMLLTTLQSMGRNLLLTLTIVMVMTAMLGSVLLLRVAGTLGAHAEEQIAKRITISLEVRELAEQRDVDALMEELRKFDHVTSVRYVSKDDARRELEDIGISVPDFLTENPFAARLRVELDSLRARTDILTYLDTSRFRDVILLTEREQLDSSYEQRVKNLERIISAVQRVGVAFAILFAVIGMLVIVTTVRLTIHTRRNELSIMQLVGASQTSIVGPFVLEGTFGGLIGAALAIALSIPAAQSIFPGLTTFFEGFSIADAIRGQLLDHFLWLALIGGGIGCVASLLSTVWYLRKQPAL